MTWLIGSKIKRSSTKSSFSLLELLVVVVILGSIISFSLPRFRATFNNLKFDNFCQDLVSRMKYLAERASVEQKNYRLYFDLKNRLIRIGAKKTDTDFFDDVSGLLGKKIPIPEGISVAIEEPSVFFYPDGNLEGKDIKIQGYQNKAIIHMKGSIGRIDLEKEYE